MIGVEMIVEHPERGRVTVYAVCKTDALLQARTAWGCDWNEVRRECRVYVPREALDRPGIRN